MASIFCRLFSLIIVCYSGVKIFDNWQLGFFIFTTGMFAYIMTYQFDKINLQEKMIMKLSKHITKMTKKMHDNRLNIK